MRSSGESVLTDETQKPARRLPPWLKRRLPAGAAAGRVNGVRALLDDLDLATVCDGAHCPNRGECYACGTATFLVLGSTCTRDCRFCAIPAEAPGPPRADEPGAVAEAAARMDLAYVVITSVTRDDLPDGGAGHFARTIAAVRRRLPDAKVEVLTPDFRGDRGAIDTVLDAAPDVFNHNVETVPRLYPAIRPAADYARSLDVLRHAGRRGDGEGKRLYTKSGLMVGLGETRDEVASVMRDLREAGCAILTIGQYLAPSAGHYPVARYVEPAVFDEMKAAAEALGFLSVASGPFVRSSYRAREVFADC